MDYSNYLAGTPVLPLIPVVAILLFALIVAHASHQVVKRRKLRIPKSLKLAALLIAGLFFVIFTTRTPKVIGTSVSSSKVELSFDTPVSRNIMVKTISPDVPGVWLFEHPIYGAHLFRRVTFYPDTPLPANSSFEVTLSNVKNVSKWSKTSDYGFSFTTTEGKTVTIPDTSISFQIYPANDEVNVDPNVTIRIVFKEDINHDEIQKEFGLTPSTVGDLAWEENTLKFDPSGELRDETKYQISLNISGKSYISSFTTRGQVVKLNVPVHLQEHALSCEVASLKMALGYRGINVSENELLAKIGVDPTPHQGNVWGNPNQAFVGNVDGRQMTTGYGVYWGPIARVARAYRDASDFQGWSIGQLTSELKKGNPVIIWTYSKSGAPTNWFTPSGEKIYAVAGEHTVTVVGFTGSADNPTQIIVNDSLIGQVYWGRVLFDKKWSVFGNSGVVVR